MPTISVPAILAQGSSTQTAGPPALKPSDRSPTLPTAAALTPTAVTPATLTARAMTGTSTPGSALAVVTSALAAVTQALAVVTPKTPASTAPRPALTAATPAVPAPPAATTALTTASLTSTPSGLLPGILTLPLTPNPTLVAPEFPIVSSGRVPIAPSVTASPTLASALAGAPASEHLSVPETPNLSWSGGQMQVPADVVGPSELGSRTSHALRDAHRAPVANGESGQSEPVLTAVSGGGTGSSASGASGFFFFGVAGLLASFALGLPRLSCRLRLIKELGTPAPVILLLDRPG